MEVANIEVKNREERGKLQVRHVRERGEIPAVVYGKGKDPRNVTVPEHRFTRLVDTHHKLFELCFEDGVKEEAYLQDMQFDVLDDSILHVDFRRIDLGERMQSEVELHFVGQPKGLAKNGVLETRMATLEIECLPKDLPEEIRINVNDLDIDESILVKDLTLPGGVKAISEADALVCQCKLRVEEAVETEEPAEGEEAAAAEPEVIGKEKRDGEGEE